VRDAADRNPRTRPTPRVPSMISSASRTSATLARAGAARAGNDVLLPVDVGQPRVAVEAAHQASRRSRPPSPARRSSRRRPR
jgi:hypothetical protein